MVEEKFYETIEGYKILDSRYWPEMLKEYLRLENKFLITTVNQNSILLDIGSGEGRHLKLLSKKCEKLFGIDNSKTMINYSKRLLKDYKNIFLSHEGVEETEFPKDSLDYIICMFNTFGNMNACAQEILLKKVSNFLKPNGSFILSVYSKNAKETQIEFYKNIGLIIKGYDKNFVYTDKLISERFTEDKIKKIFESKVNLEVNNIIKLNDISYIIIIKKRPVNE